MELFILDPPSIELGKERGPGSSGLTMFALADLIRGLRGSPAPSTMFAVAVCTTFESSSEVRKDSCASCYSCGTELFERKRVTLCIVRINDRDRFDTDIV